MKYVVVITRPPLDTKVIIFTPKWFDVFKQDYDNFKKICELYKDECPTIKEVAKKIQDCSDCYFKLKDKKNIVFDENCDERLLLLKDFSIEDIEDILTFLWEYLSGTDYFGNNCYPESLEIQYLVVRNKDGFTKL
jgi:hypothetical protein